MRVVCCWWASGVAILRYTGGMRQYQYDNSQEQYMTYQQCKGGEREVRDGGGDLRSVIGVKHVPSEGLERENEANAPGSCRLR